MKVERLKKMEWTGKCHECDIDLVYCQQESTITWTCPVCGWGLATTYISPIYHDINNYEVFLLKDFSPKPNQLRVISRISGLNLIESKKLLGTDEAFLFKGKAADVLPIKTQLEQEEIGFKIVPEYNW